jgi:hypothetical protein
MEFGCIGILPIIFESPGACTFHIAHFPPSLDESLARPFAAMACTRTPLYTLKTPRHSFWILGVWVYSLQKTQRSEEFAWQQPLAGFTTLVHRGAHRDRRDPIDPSKSLKQMA